MIGLQYFELNPDLGITPTDCESRNEISSPGNDSEDAEEISFVPSGPSRFSHAADVQMSASYHCRGHESDVEDGKT